MGSLFPGTRGFSGVPESHWACSTRCLLLSTNPSAPVVYIQPRSLLQVITLLPMWSCPSTNSAESGGLDSLCLLIGGVRGATVSMWFQGSPRLWRSRRQLEFDLMLRRGTGWASNWWTWYKSSSGVQGRRTPTRRGRVTVVEVEREHTTARGSVGENTSITKEVKLGISQGDLGVYIHVRTMDQVRETRES